MPVLKQYADKSGYFVHTSVTGADHPITLQTGEIAAEIYRHLGYEPDQNGNSAVSVPNELTWKLYEVGLHWTNSSGTEGLIEGLPERKVDGDGPPLTEKDIEKLSDLLGKYGGEGGEKVDELISELTDFDPRQDSRVQIQAPGESTDSGLSLWEFPEVLWDKIAQHLEDLLIESLNHGKVMEWSADVEIGEWEPDEDPGKSTISTRIEHIADPDQKYFHTLYLCEEHGPERCLTLAKKESWSNRCRIESHRTKLIDCLAKTSNKFNFPLGAPFATMDIRLIHNSEVFEE